jgi:nitrate reductase NapE component
MGREVVVGVLYIVVVGAMGSYGFVVFSARIEKFI